MTMTMKTRVTFSEVRIGDKIPTIPEGEYFVVVGIEPSTRQLRVHLKSNPDRQQLVHVPHGQTVIIRNVSNLPS